MCAITSFNHTWILFLQDLEVGPVFRKLRSCTANILGITVRDVSVTTVPQYSVMQPHFQSRVPEQAPKTGSIHHVHIGNKESQWGGVNFKLGL